MNYSNLIRAYILLFFVAVMVVSVYGAVTLAKHSAVASISEANVSVSDEYSNFRNSESLVTPTEELSSVLSSTETSWSDHFKLSDADIPTNAFKAFYFDTTNPRTVQKTEIVDSVDINYAWSEGSGFQISSENFGGYWVGYFIFDSSLQRTIHIAQSWSEARVVIDGLVVYQGGSSRSFDYQFKAGRHKIEVEFANNWHTVGFSVHILPEQQHYSASQIATALQPISHDPTAQFWIASPYESSDFHSTIQLTLKPSAASVVLFLSSYSPVTWMYPTNSSTNVKAIVLSSFEPGTTIRNVPPDVQVYLYKDWIEFFDSSNLSPQCSAKDEYCDQEYDFRKAALVISNMTHGKKPTGAGGSYAAKNITLPTVILDNVTYLKMDADAAASEKARYEYQHSQQLDNIFQ